MAESTLLREIAEQPARLRALLEEGADEVEEAGRTLRRHPARHVVIAARGSSDNAARYAQYVLGAFNRLTVTLATPSLFTRYGAPPRMEDAVVVGISQSGQSPDLVAVVEEARRQGCPTIAITNAPGSPLASAADRALLLRAGPELSVAATKTYTAQLLLLAMLSAAAGDDAKRKDELQAVPGQVAAALETGDDALAAAATTLEGAGHGVVIARGFNYATAFEIALKMKELACFAAEPYSAADFQHGPVALIDTGFAAVVVNARGAVSGEVEDLLRVMAGRGATPVVLSNLDSSLALASAPLPLPAGVPEWLSPIVAVVPGQLLAFHLARRRGFDPDRPRGLSKVTRTR